MVRPLIINKKTTMYDISSDGYIINRKTQKVLTGTERNGYLTVKLTIDGIKKDFLVHRLVALTFLDNENNLPQVNHKNKNRKDNRYENLEWVTAKENCIHRGKSKKDSPSSQKIEINLSNWKQYKNTFYYVSEDGECYNLKTHRLLTPTSNGNYLRYNLCSNGERYSVLAHKMIYEAFHSDYNPKQVINHIDGNSKNNKLNNLELVSQQENMLHSYYILNHNINSIGQYDLNDKIIATFPSLSKAAQQLNISVSGISQACSGKLKTYKGFKWKKIV